MNAVRSTLIAPMNQQANKNGVLELTSSVHPGIPSLGLNGQESDELRTMEVGEQLDFDQVMLSAFLHQHVGESDSESVPGVLVTDEAIASTIEVGVDSTPRTKQESLRITLQALAVNKRLREDILDQLVQFGPGN